MFRWLYDGEFGLINYALSWVRIEGPKWLIDPVWAMPAVAMVTVWQGLGYNMVLYLAGCKGSLSICMKRPPSTAQAH